MNDKNIEKSGAMEAPAAPARAHNAGDGAVGAGPVGRFSAQRKLAAGITTATGLRHLMAQSPECGLHLRFKRSYNCR